MPQIDLAIRLSANVLVPNMLDDTSMTGDALLEFLRFADVQHHGSRHNHGNHNREENSNYPRSVGVHGQHLTGNAGSKNSPNSTASHNRSRGS